MSGTIRRLVGREAKPGQVLYSYVDSYKNFRIEIGRDLSLNHSLVPFRLFNDDNDFIPKVPSIYIQCTLQ